MRSSLALSSLLLLLLLLVPESMQYYRDQPATSSPILSTTTIEKVEPSICSDGEEFNDVFQRISLNDSIIINNTSSSIYLEFPSPVDVFAGELICEGCGEDIIYYVEVDFILLDNRTTKRTITIEATSDDEDRNCSRRSNNSSSTSSSSYSPSSSSSLSSSSPSSPPSSSSSSPSPFFNFSSSSPTNSSFSPSPFSPSSSPPPSVSVSFRFQVLPAERNVTAVNISLLSSSVPWNQTIRNLSLFDLKEHIEELSYDKDNGSLWCISPRNTTSCSQSLQNSSNTSSTCAVYMLPKRSRVKFVAVRIGVRSCKTDNDSTGPIPLQVLLYRDNQSTPNSRPVYRCLKSSNNEEASGIRNSVVVFKRCNTGLDNDTYLEIIREQSAPRRRFCVETVEVYVWTASEADDELWSPPWRLSTTTRLTFVNTSSSANATISARKSSRRSRSTPSGTTSANVISTTSTKPSPSTTTRPDRSTANSTSHGYSTTDTSVVTSSNTTLEDTHSSTALNNASSPSSSTSSLSSSVSTTTTTTTTNTTTSTATLTTTATSTTTTAITTNTSSTPSSTTAAATTSTTTLSNTPQISPSSSPSSTSSSSSSSSLASTTDASTTTSSTKDLSTTIGQTVASTTGSQLIIVNITSILLKNKNYDNNLGNKSSPKYNSLKDEVNTTLTEICTKMNLQLIRVLSIDFRKGSVLVDTTLEFSQNITEDQKQGLKDAVQNGFAFQGGVTDIVAVVVGSVIGFLFIFVSILVVIFLVRWCHTKRQRRLQPEPTQPEPDATGGAFSIQRPPALLWQSSVATSSLSRRRDGQSSVMELSVHGLEGGESYVGTDDGSGKEKHLAGTIRAKNGIRDPALRHYGDVASDVVSRPGRLGDAKAIAAGQVWNGAIPRPELDTTRFDELRPNAESVFECRKVVGSDQEVRWGQGGIRDEVRRQRDGEELRGGDVGRIGGVMGGGFGEGRGQGGGRLGGVGFGGGGLRGGLGGGPGGFGMEGGLLGGFRTGALIGSGGSGEDGVDVNIWGASDSGQSDSERGFPNHQTSNPLFPNDRPIFSGLAPVLQTSRSPTPFERSLPISARAGDRVEQRVPNAFEGLFVPTMPFQRHSDSSGASSARHLLPPIDAGTTGIEGGVHRTTGTVGQMEASFDDAALSEVLTLHDSKHKTQNGILSRLGSLSRKQKPDNIHRTPTRNEMKKGSQLALANGGDSGMYL